MEMKDENTKDVIGAEGIILHNGKIVLGMQRPRRWYKLDNGESAAIIKTIGGKIEQEDNGSSKSALVRELFEEVKGIELKDIRVSKIPIFSKKIMMSELNPYEEDSGISLNADFYVLEILNKENITPNDLPALVEVPIERFLRMDFSKQNSIKGIQNFIIENEKNNFELPENYALMIPKEVKKFFERLREDNER